MGKSYSYWTIERYRKMQEKGINCEGIGNCICLRKAKKVFVMQIKSNLKIFEYRFCEKHALRFMNANHVNCDVIDVRNL